MFQLPGDIQLFLFLNFVLIIVVLYGFSQVIQQRRSASLFSYVLAGTGIFAFSIHAALILAGHPEFRASASIVLLVATLLVSVVQIIVVMRSNFSADIEARHQ